MRVEVTHLRQREKFSWTRKWPASKIISKRLKNIVSVLDILCKNYIIKQSVLLSDNETNNCVQYSLLIKEIFDCSYPNYNSYAKMLLFNCFLINTYKFIKGSMFYVIK